MKKVFAVAAAGMLLTGMSWGSAQAQCYWNGMGTTCVSPPVTDYTAPYYWGTPYPAFNAYDYQDYRLRPDWLPSFPGPRPGGR